MAQQSTVARYEVLTVPTAHTPTELAAHWLAELDVACTAATPSFAGATGAYAKWEGMPTHANLVTANVFDAKSEHKALDGTTVIPADGFAHIEVCAGDDTSTTAVIAATADAIDKAVLGTLTVDGAMVSAVTTTCKVHAAEAAAVALLQQCLDIDGFCYLLVGDEAEVIKVTDIDVDGVTLTIVRGAAGSTASSSWDDDEALAWYCGADNTVIGVDDESVWGTLAAHTAAGGHLVVICGTEQMLVTDLIAGTIPDTFVATRGYDGTTAAVHADNAAVTQYIDEGTAIFNVDNGALLVDECYYKIALPSTITEPIVSTTATSMTLADASIFSDIAGYTPTVAHPIYLEFATGGEIVGVTAIVGEVATIVRGVGGTTAATQLDNAVITYFGTEVFKVKTIATHRITATRGCHDSVETILSNGATVYRLWGPEIYDAALLAVNTIADGTFQEGHYGTPSFRLGTVGGSAWSTSTQTETA